jgi:hypothetical protein
MNLSSVSLRAACAGAVFLVLQMPSIPAAEGTAARPGRLRVSDDGHYLVYADGPREGQGFLYLADTAWQLLHRLDREEATRYLENRARKGFTVIQTVALAELDGLRTPNAHGRRPLIDADPLRPDVREGPGNDYWDHVDYVVRKAASLGLHVGLLPTWGDKWQASKGGAGPVIFDPPKARAYGRWIAARYRDDAIIWILGGDRNIETDEDRAVIEAMAQGLEEGDGGAHLITYHPRGPGMSSEYFHGADWLDFNMCQSSHAARDHDNGLFIEHDYALRPPKPTLDGEPRYERIPVGFYNRGESRLVTFDDADCRQAAYWALLAGACGHTYGNNNVWQMWEPGRQPLIGADIPWHEALDHPGAFQMGHVRRLFESRPFTKLEPDDSFVLDGPRTGGARIRAARARDGSFAFVYSPRGKQFSVRMGVIASRSVRSWWFDPRYGTAADLHTSDNAAIQSFVPPSSGRGQDWLLVLDDATAGFPPPGGKR